MVNNTIFQSPAAPGAERQSLIKNLLTKKMRQSRSTKKKLPLKTRLYSKRYVAALILFIIGIKSLTVITRDAFIAEYPDIINFNSTYFVAFVFLICIPFLGVLGFMYDSEQKNNPRDDSKNDLVSMFKTQLQFYYLAPFKYGYRCIKERNYKGLVLFATFISALAFLFV